MKRWIIFSFITVYLGLILFANRGTFTSRFNAAYWKDRYEHSQWQLPTSSRTIGDDGLYLYAGYRLIHGDNPASINPEMPPLGKYLIGTSIKIFGNGNWYGFFTTFASLIIFFLLTKRLLKNTTAAFATTMVFALDPLVISQWPLTMLDSLQLFFLLLTMFMLTSKKPSPIWVGLSFGLFSSVKTPVFSPLLGLVIIFTLRKPKSILVFLACACLTYLIPYVQFFLLGHSILDWINLQRWIIGFYRTSRLSPNIGSVFTTVLVNRTQNLFTHTWEQSSQWSPVWPLITVLSVGAFLRKISDPTWKPMVVLVSLLTVMMFVIPFWTRYLLLVLPFLYAAGMFMLIKLEKTTWVVLFIVVLSVANVLSSIDILFPTPQATVADFTYSWEHGFFGDMYEHLSSASKTQDRQSFHSFGLKTFYDGQIEAANIEILTPHWSRLTSPQTIDLRVTYFTRELGSFAQTETFPVTNENGRWVIPWQWGYLLDGFTQKSHVETSVIPARRGSIVTSKGKFLARDEQGFMVWITPNKVSAQKENAMLTYLARAFNHHPIAVSIHDRYVTNALPDIPIAIGTVAIKPPYFPGLTVTPHFVRVASRSGLLANTAYTECCSLLYSTTNYDGISGLEQQYNKELKGINGGTLIVRDEMGAIVRTILDLRKIDGQNVVIQ